MVDIPYSLVFMSVLIFLPAFFAAVLLIPGLFSSRRPEAIRWWALFGTALTLTVCLCMLISYYYDVVQFHLSEPSRALLSARAPQIDGTDGATAPTPSQSWVVRYPWVERFHIQYYLGVDGISMPLLLLTALLAFLAMLASWKLDSQLRSYCVLFLLLETGVLGAFLALDFFLFFVFLQATVLPVYYLIGLWGHSGRERAAGKYLVYSIAGSGLILVAMVACYATNVRDFANPDLVQARVAAIQRNHPELTREQAQDQVTVHSFDLILLQSAGAAAAEVRHGDRPAHGTLAQPFFASKTFQLWIFLALFVGFAIKLPVFPLHAWLTAAQAEAPTPVSMILSGVMLNLGGYGLLRIACPLFPAVAQSLAGALALFGVINIVFGALTALGQSELKRMLAYSSVSQMGYVILGVAVWSAGTESASWGLNGALFQMIAHGVTAAGLFFFAGILYDRIGAPRLADVRGLFRSMPILAAMSGVIFFAALGLPGLCCFIGECWVVIAAWSVSHVYAICAALAMVLSAGYIVRGLQRAWLSGSATPQKWPDLSLREVLCALPLAMLAVLLGVLPNTLFFWSEPTLSAVATQEIHAASPDRHPRTPG